MTISLSRKMSLALFKLTRFFHAGFLRASENLLKDPAKEPPLCRVNIDQGLVGNGGRSERIYRANCKEPGQWEKSFISVQTLLNTVWVLM